MHLKVFMKLKNPKNSLFWANMYKKNPKNPKNPKKNKKNTELGFFLKKPGFFQPCLGGDVVGGADRRFGADHPVRAHLHAGPEVRQLEVALGVQQHVVRFHVPVSDFFSKLECDKLVIFLKYFFGGFFLFCSVQYSALLHLPPLRFHCADGCWDRTQDRCN